MLRASEPARAPIVVFRTGLGRLKPHAGGGSSGGADGSSGQPPGSPGGHRQRLHPRRQPVLRVHHPQLCLASLGTREWALIDLKPAITYFFKVA